MLSYLNDLIEAVKQLNFHQIEELAEHLRYQRAMGHRVYVCGNGGSHAVAIHWGVDLAKIGKVDINTLGTNQALLTAVSNDLDYSVALSTELVLRAQAGKDTLICLSCSGRSTNIRAALTEAQKLLMPTYLITGYQAPEYYAARTIRVMSKDYGILEDVFSAINHWLTKELAQ